MLLIELWASDEAVQEHGQTPHFKMLGELKMQYVADTVIKRYGIAED